MGKSINGLKWYQQVYKFLSSQECYLVVTQSEEQKSILIGVIATNKSCGIRLKAEIKKYGLYVSRGKHGNSAMLTKDLTLLYCKRAGLKFDLELKRKRIIRYTAEMFKDCHHSKNIAKLEREKEKPITYEQQLEDKNWKDFRKFIFSVRGKKCEICGGTHILQVHHPKYISGRKAWEYNCNEVMVVCKECHQKLHGIK